MKVDSTSRNGARSLQADVTRTQQGDSAGATSAGGTTSAATTASSSTGSDANVSLSSLSSTLRSLAASGSADIDVAHVESIKDAIRNGTLQIDTGKIADGVLETARNLLKPSSGN
ncbi:flagellar biosynthesis anti-sigma factor FlgM [Paraburkholderia dinghuensis]|uniref:Negative regulator of flagellin synthesis n=1 Tax=Paraburkholderia dinghuensis TaxID=2305225 RepID=A0A3N6Q1E9_9BURK|nr:flagellar biosynthesis anti-sigma factor FlgM [Paraburkholderia dinghuensis]RQH06036.1 flagellar biosynthesis anti-sigma factor FlgM [Paraburkholderia dinghuensis]